MSDWNACDPRECCVLRQFAAALSAMVTMGTAPTKSSSLSLLLLSMLTTVQVLAAQTLKIASINGLGDTEKLETELEDEIRWEESRRAPSEVIGR